MWLVSSNQFKQMEEMDIQLSSDTNGSRYLWLYNLVTLIFAKSDVEVSPWILKYLISFTTTDISAGFCGRVMEELKRLNSFGIISVVWLIRDVWN